MIDSKFLERVAPIMERYKNAKKHNCPLTAQARVRDMIKVYANTYQADKQTATADVAAWLRAVIATPL